MSRLIAICLALLLLAIPAAATAQDRLSRESGRRLASDLIAAGQPLAAREVALALVRADPEDAVALILLSRAERLLGAPEAALLSGREAWQAADRPDLRFGAAVVRAQALVDLDRTIAAQLWLRRAAQVAENDAARDLAESEYRAVRAMSPMRVHLSFGVTPRSNINNGGANLTYALHPAYVEILREFLGNPDLNPVGSLSETERPLSGVELRGGVNLSYRLDETPRSLTRLSVGLSYRSYILSSSAEDTAPDASGSDFADAQLNAGVFHGWRGDGDVTHRIRADAGLVWYGGEAHSRWLRLSYGQSWAMEDGRLSVEGRLRGDWYASDRPREVEASLNLGWAQDLGPGELVLSSAVTRRVSDTADRGYDSLALGVEYNWGEVGENSVFFGLEGREYERTLHIEGTRNDLIGTARLSLAVPGVEYFGFRPVVTIEGRDQRSNAERPESRSLGAGLNLVSSF